MGDGGEPDAPLWWPLKCWKRETNAFDLYLPLFREALFIHEAKTLLLIAIYTLQQSLLLCTFNRLIYSVYALCFWRLYSGCVKRRKSSVERVKCSSSTYPVFSSMLLIIIRMQFPFCLLKIHPSALPVSGRWVSFSLCSPAVKTAKQRSIGFIKAPLCHTHWALKAVCVCAHRLAFIKQAGIKLPVCHDCTK